MLILVVVMLVASCAPDNYHTYVIPDDYEGFLVIHYDCADGQSLYNAWGNVHVTFQEDGTACVQESIPGGLFFPEVETHSGTTVYFQDPPYSEASGYAFVDIATKIRRPRPRDPNDEIPRYVFSVMWAGEMENLTVLRQSRDYELELYEFINENFDIKQPGH
jgi:hypothetical protein